MLATLALALAFSQPASAQASDPPIINLPPSISARPATQAPFPIRVGRAPPNSFVQVRGLPPTAALSDGHSIAPGAWAVPLNALPGLQIVLPAMVTGKAAVVVAVVGVDGSVLAKTRCTLLIAGPPVLTAQDRERALRLLQKGNEQLAKGLVAPARLLYERAAELGLAQSAMALAATYDAVELDRRRLRDVQSDAANARRWYERALALGAHEAEQRLRRLGKN